MVKFDNLELTFEGDNYCPHCGSRKTEKVGEFIDFDLRGVYFFNNYQCKKCLNIFTLKETYERKTLQNVGMIKLEGVALSTGARRILAYLCQAYFSS